MVECDVVAEETKLRERRRHARETLNCGILEQKLESAAESQSRNNNEEEKKRSKRMASTRRGFDPLFFKRKTQATFLLPFSLAK